LFDHIQFYDYTKSYARVLTKEISNYHLTYSQSDRKLTSYSFVDLLENKIANIAIVFKGYLPDYYKGYKVINGDATDLRFLDQSGVIVGLSAKAKAKKDTSGFVVA